MTQEKGDTKTATPLIKPTLKRYIILLLFGLNSGNKSFQWVQIPASTAKITYFYGVENYVINTLSVVFMLSFLVLSWPACYVIKKIGLRYAVLMASFGTAIGAIIKCYSCHEHGIGLLFLGQVIVSLSEQLIFSVPSRLASVWFPDHEVSICVAMCIFGNQVGNALGFIVPQAMMSAAETKEEIGDSLYSLFFGLSLYSMVLFAAGLVLFDEAPEQAPGAARLKQIAQEKAEKDMQQGFRDEMRQICSQIRDSLSNRDYTILSFHYGLVLGCFYALSTVLNQMLSPLWPGDDILIGNAGSIMIVAGVLGLPLWGRLMDRTHRYLWINMFLTLATTLSFLLFGYTVSYGESEWAIYISSLLIGLFVTGLIASGLEFAVELTYPAPEMITTSIMNIQPSIFSTVIIYIASFIVDIYGALACNVFFVLVCSFAFLLLPFVRENLNRQRAVIDRAAEQNSEKGPRFDVATSC